MHRTQPFPFAILLVLLSLCATSVWSIPRPEHPRPDLRRSDWINLNGEWLFGFDPDNFGEIQEWYQPGYRNFSERIQVPFPWESELSGIGNTEYKGVAWYRRTITIPEEWDGRAILLHFGAVDWSAKVWINGRFVSGFNSGYVPASIPIHRFVDAGDNTLVVKVTDHTDRQQPTGKQINWYTRTSGIWQTVYLEALNSPQASWLESIHPITKMNGDVTLRLKTAGLDADSLTVRIMPDQPYDAAGPMARIPQVVEQTFGSPTNQSLDVSFSVPNPHLWSPQSPTLYFVKVELWSGETWLDTVHTYFGIREVGRAKWDEQSYESILLNGKPFYILSALNQAFHPDGIYTYPSDEVIRQDIQDALDFGFNNLRLHIKLDEPRFYYWCDRLGCTVLYDFPSFWQYGEDAKNNFLQQLVGGINRDAVHPSILAWVVFNETWGYNDVKHEPEVQDWIREMVHTAKRMDPTRLVEDNSPNKYDHIVTDINSWHFYIYDHEHARLHIQDAVANVFPGSQWNYLEGYTQGTEPFMNSEYGGVSAGMGDRDISWCFHYLTNELRRHAKIVGYVYTELQDIEWEHNGFMNYDRSHKVFGYEEFVPVPEDHPPFTYRDINASDYLVIDALAGENLSMLSHAEIPAALCLYSGRDGGAFDLHWRVHSMTRLSSGWELDQVGRGRMDGVPHDVLPGDPIAFRVEPERLYCVYAWVEDEHGEPVARNFWVFHTLQANSLGTERLAQMMAGADNPYLGGPTWFVRWKPTEMLAMDGTLQEQPDDARYESVSIPGAASVQYRVSIPDGVNLGAVKKATLQMELAACAGINRVDWKQSIRQISTPQTDADTRYPSTIDVLVNDVLVETLVLPNDPADYRGVLSNIFHTAPPSAYGYLQEVDVPVSLIRSGRPLVITLRTAENSDTGIRIFGGRSGRYLISPTLKLEQAGS